jgi:RNA recognition motif-containing protein
MSSAKDTPSTSWADETDEYETNSQPQPTPNKWAKGNPYGIAPPKITEEEANGRENVERRDEQQRDERRTYGRREDRSGGYRDREDRGGYPSRDREDSYFSSRSRDDYRDRDHGGRGGRFREERRPREPREPREERAPVPLPTSPPFTAFVGNLPFEATKEDLYQFFEPKCQIQSVRLVFDGKLNRSKGYGYVEFDNLDSLKAALTFHGSSLFDRPLKIDVAEAKPEDRSPKRGDSGRRFTGGFGRNGDRDFDRKRSPERRQPEEERREESPKEQDESVERPKVQINPPTKAQTTKEPSQSEAYATAKVNPFGGARPRDENAILKKKEEERKQREEAERKKKEEDQDQTKGSVEGKEINKEQSPVVPKEDTPQESSPSHFRSKGRDDREGFRRDDREGFRRDDRPPRGRDDKEGFRRDDKDRPRGYGRGSFRRDEKRREDDKPRRDSRSDKPQVRQPQKETSSENDVKTTNIFAALPEEDE